MDAIYSIWETVKPILAVIALLLVPFTILNLYFNLFPRFKGIWSERSKKSFLKKLEEQRLEFEKIIRFKNLSTPSLIIKLLNEAADVLFGFITTFFFLVFTIAYSIILSNDTSLIIRIIIIVGACLSYICSLFTLRLTLKFTRFCGRLNYNYIFAESIIKLLNKGKEKNFVENTDYNLVEIIVNSELYTDAANDQLRILAGLEPKILTETKDAMSELKKVLDGKAAGEISK